MPASTAETNIPLWLLLLLLSSSTHSRNFLFALLQAPFSSPWPTFVLFCCLSFYLIYLVEYAPHPTVPPDGGRMDGLMDDLCPI